MFAEMERESKPRTRTAVKESNVRSPPPPPPRQLSPSAATHMTRGLSPYYHTIRQRVVEAQQRGRPSVLAGATPSLTVGVLSGPTAVALKGDVANAVVNGRPRFFWLLQVAREEERRRVRLMERVLAAADDLYVAMVTDAHEVAHRARTQRVATANEELRLQQHEERVSAQRRTLLSDQALQRELLNRMEDGGFRQLRAEELRGNQRIRTVENVRRRREAAAAAMAASVLQFSRGGTDANGTSLGAYNRGVSPETTAFEASERELLFKASAVICGLHRPAFNWSVLSDPGKRSTHEAAESPEDTHASHLSEEDDDNAGISSYDPINDYYLKTPLGVLYRASPRQERRHLCRIEALRRKVRDAASGNGSDCIEDSHRYGRTVVGGAAVEAPDFVSDGAYVACCSISPRGADSESRCTGLARSNSNPLIAVQRVGRGFRARRVLAELSSGQFSISIPLGVPFSSRESAAAPTSPVVHYSQDSRRERASSRPTSASFERDGNQCQALPRIVRGNSPGADPDIDGGTPLVFPSHPCDDQRRASQSSSIAAGSFGVFDSAGTEQCRNTPLGPSGSRKPRVGTHDAYLTQADRLADAVYRQRHALFPHLTPNEKLQGPYAAAERELVRDQQRVVEEHGAGGQDDPFPLRRLLPEHVVVYNAKTHFNAHAALTNWRRQRLHEINMGSGERQNVMRKQLHRRVDDHNQQAVAREAQLRTLRLRRQRAAETRLAAEKRRLWEDERATFMTAEQQEIERLELHITLRQQFMRESRVQATTKALTEVPGAERIAAMTSAFSSFGARAAHPKRKSATPQPT